MSKFEAFKFVRLEPGWSLCAATYESLLILYRENFGEEPRALLLPTELLETGYRIYAEQPTLTRLPIIPIPIDSVAFCVVGDDGIVASEPT